MAATVIAEIVSSAAGMSLRRRRSQNARNDTRPDRACSPTISEVMRNPESVKKVDTPRNPPGVTPVPEWYMTTASTARPRRPSSDRW